MKTYSCYHFILHWQYTLKVISKSFKVTMTLDPSQPKNPIGVMFGYFTFGTDLMTLGGGYTWFILTNYF